MAFKSTHRTPDRGLTAQIAVDALVDAFLAGPGGVLGTGWPAG
ncbi:MAG TPA: hypothetical protein VHW23_34550 [Kofleriaceae bacterium]|jgi:hypothetical protein|nr:hypothetical protein [Kofleriaceae bacterium]